MVCMQFPPMRSLQTLDVHDGCISGLENLSSLTNLTLKDIAAIPDEPFSLPPTLTHLGIKHVAIHDATLSTNPPLFDSWNVIGRAVSALPALKHLCTNMLPHIMGASSKAVPAFAHSLQSLRITETMDSKCAEAMRSLSSVESVVFSRIRNKDIPEDAFSAIGQPAVAPH